MSLHFQISPWSLKCVIKPNQYLCKLTLQTRLSVTALPTCCCWLLLQISHVRWFACLSVCVIVGHTDELCKNDWTNRSTGCWEWTRKSLRNHVLDDGPDPPIARATATPYTMDSSILGPRRLLGEDTINTTQQGRHAAAMRPVAQLLWTVVHGLTCSDYKVIDWVEELSLVNRSSLS